MAAVETEFFMPTDSLSTPALVSTKEDDPVAELEKLFPFRYTERDDDYRKCVEKRHRMYRVPVVKPWPPPKMSNRHNRRNRPHHRYNDVDRSDWYTDRYSGGGSRYERHNYRNEYGPPQYHRRYHNQRSPYGGPPHREGGHNDFQQNEEDLSVNPDNDHHLDNNYHSNNNDQDNSFNEDPNYTRDHYHHDNHHHDNHRHDDHHHDNHHHNDHEQDGAINATPLFKEEEKAIPPSNTMASIVSSLNSSNDKPPPTDSDVLAILSNVSSANNNKVNFNKQKKKAITATQNDKQHNKQQQRQQQSEQQSVSKKRKLSDSVLVSHGATKSVAASILLAETHDKVPSITRKRKRKGGVINDASDEEEDEFIDPVNLNQDTLELTNKLRQGAAMQQQNETNTNTSNSSKGGAFYHQPESLRVSINLQSVQLKEHGHEHNSLKNVKKEIDHTDYNNSSLKINDNIIDFDQEIFFEKETSFSPNHSLDDSFDYSTNTTLTPEASTVKKYSGAVTVDDSKKQLVLVIKSSSIIKDSLATTTSGSKKSRKGKKKKKKNKDH